MEAKVDNCIGPTKEHLQVLKENFSHDKFKQEQWQAISQIIAGKQDLFIHASSGFGKSLIYQYPPVYLKKKALVISPLISLMETQVQKLESQGIASIYISGQQKHLNLDLKKYTVIYTTPENFATIKNNIKWAVESGEICMIAIDEAHCISKLSGDHRQAYSILKNLGEAFPQVPIVALTSTVSENAHDICTLLGIKNEVPIKTSIDRKNIQYICTPQSISFTADVVRYLMDMPKGDGAIIYVYKKADTEHYADMLTREGLEAKPYHSGLVEEIRRETLRDFMSGRLNFIVTTNALGMGLDRANVRVVIHYGLPKNMETYYIESGRAGRDGNPAKSIIFWSDRDIKFHNYCFKENSKKKHLNQESKHNTMLLSKIQDYSVIKNCRRVNLLGNLGEKAPQIISESCCDNCLQTLHDKVGARKMYKEINADGLLDVTKDVRMLLNLINSYRGKCKSEILVDFITGKMPIEFDPNHPVEYFSCGLHKPKSWWLNILKIVKDKRFTERHTVVLNTDDIMDIIAGISRDDYIRTTQKGLKFIRSKSQKCVTYPKSEFFHSLTKTDTEYYIVNNEIKEKPRHGTNSNVSSNDIQAFDFSAFSTQLNNKSPRKRLASESEYSDISLTELFKLADSDSPRSPKLPKTSGTRDVSDAELNAGPPGCSHWYGSSKHSNTKVNGTATHTVEPMKTRSKSIVLKKCTIKVPLLRSNDANANELSQQQEDNAKDANEPNK